MTTADIDTKLHLDEQFTRRVHGAVAQAAQAGVSYAVLACIPQHMPGESVDDVLELAASAVRKFVRQEDLAGLIDGEVLVIGLAETDLAAARIFGYRLQSDLGVRSARLRTTIWDAGVATLPEDGSSATELLLAAIDAARNRRRRLGAL